MGDPWKVNLENSFCQTCPLTLYIREPSIRLPSTKTSKVSLLRVGPCNPVYGHVISFRKQVYITDLQEEKQPSPFVISDDDSNHHTSTDFEEVTRFKCKSKFHKAEDWNAFPDQKPNQASSFPDPNVRPRLSKLTITLRYRKSIIRMILINLLTQTSRNLY